MQQWQQQQQQQQEQEQQQQWQQQQWQQQQWQQQEPTAGPGEQWAFPHPNGPPLAQPSYPGGWFNQAPGEQQLLATWDTSPSDLQAMLDARAEAPLPPLHAPSPMALNPSTLFDAVDPDAPYALPSCWISEEALQQPMNPSPASSGAALSYVSAAMLASTSADLPQTFPASARYTKTEPKAFPISAAGHFTGYHNHSEHLDLSNGLSAPAAPSWPASALGAPAPLAPSARPSDAQVELDKARRRVDKLLAELKRSGGKDRRGRPDELVQRMRGLLAQLEGAVAENQRIVSRQHLTRTQIQLADQERAWMQLDAAHGGAPLVAQAKLLAPAARPAGSGAQVSVLQLPPADGWSELWTARVRGMQTLDVLTLHRQFIQHCAMLLPKADMPQLYPSAVSELEEFYARYRTFSQQLIRLAPGPWYESSKYDLDTLQPLSAPMSSHPLEPFLNTNFLSPEELESMMAVIWHFNGNMAKLQQQQQQLQQQLDRVNGGGSRRTSSTSSGTSSTEFPVEPEVGVEASMVLKQLAANLREQKFLHRTFFYSVNCAISAASLTRMRLLMYPFATNGQLFLNDPHSTDAPNSNNSPNSSSDSL